MRHTTSGYYQGSQKKEYLNHRKTIVVHAANLMPTNSQNKHHLKSVFKNLHK